MAFSGENHIVIEQFDLEVVKHVVVVGSEACNPVPIDEGR